jgi:uncharacterized protein YbaP (TraB family)
MEKNNMTAIEWLAQELPKIDMRMLGTYLTLIEQAKQMEKDQIVKAYLEGDRNGFTRYKLGGEEQSTSEQYYQETYGKKEDTLNQISNISIGDVIGKKPTPKK